MNQSAVFRRGKKRNVNIRFEQSWAGALPHNVWALKSIVCNGAQCAVPPAAPAARSPTAALPQCGSPFDRNSTICFVLFSKHCFVLKLNFWFDFYLRLNSWLSGILLILCPLPFSKFLNIPVPSHSKPMLEFFSLISPRQVSIYFLVPKTLGPNVTSDC